MKSVLRHGTLLVIFGYLGFKLSEIGWGNIFQSMPTSPVFFILAFAFACLPIIAETLTFQKVTGDETQAPFRLFLRKHVINEVVMKYAGDAYFIQQLSKLKGLDLRSAAITVKNLALIRTFIANFWLILLVLIAFAFGQGEVMHRIVLVSPALIITVGLISFGVCLGAILFFRKLTQLDFGLAGKVASIYLMRSALAACLLIAQWHLILPETSLRVWGLFLLVYTLTKKSPVGGPLVFVSVAITLPGLGADSAAIAAMLLTTTAVVQVFYSLGFVMTSEFTLNKARVQPLPLLKAKA